jgi:hypothetical protein
MLHQLVYIIYLVIVAILPYSSSPPLLLSSSPPLPLSPTQKNVEKFLI